MVLKLPAHRGLSRAIVLALSIIGLAAPAAAATTMSWNGARWARTGPLKLKTIDRTSSAWTRYIAPALTGWSAASQLDLVGSRGSVNSACSGVYATIQVCNGTYGNTGWLGYAYVWTQGSFIVQATVKLNDTYFSQARYNNSAWRSSVLCQELGHTIGLAHNNTNRSDTNTGSCMDYSNDPDGGGTYGKSNLKPGTVDFAGLNIIYRSLDKTQLSTGALALASEGLYLPGFSAHDQEAGSVPEPSTWALLIAGLGLVGAAMRKRRVIVDA